MNSAIAATSSCTPWYFFGSTPGAARLKPVDTGSMNTRSVMSSKDKSLSTSLAGGGGCVPSSCMNARFGPQAPRCSQTDDDPGPPLKQNVTGRAGSGGETCTGGGGGAGAGPVGAGGSVTLTRWYATKKMLACGLPSSSRKM